MNHTRYHKVMVNLTDEKILEQIVKPCLLKAEETIPFFEIGPNPEALVLYGAPGAVLDSLNLVTFVFQIEEEVSIKLGREIKITTQDVLDTATNPFASLPNLAKFLLRKIQNESTSK